MPSDVLLLRSYRHAKRIFKRQSKSKEKENERSQQQLEQTALFEACMKNAPPSSIRAILKREPNSAFIQDADGNTIIDLLFHHHKVIKSSPVDAQVIRALLSVNPNSALKYSPITLSKLHPTVLSSDGVLAILESYTSEMMQESLEPKYSTCMISTTILHLACRYNATTSPDLIEKMLRHLPAHVVTLRDAERYRTPLHWACCAWGEASSSALSQTNIENNSRVVQMLLQHNPQTALWKDDKSFTPLHLAVQYTAPLSIIEALLSSKHGKAAVIKKNVNGDSPLHTLIDLDSSPSSSYISAVLLKLLRANPAAAHETNQDELSPFEIAATRPAQLIVDYCRVFLFDVILSYSEDIVKDAFDENGIEWTGYYGEYLCGDDLGDYEELDASPSQKYLDYLGIFVSEATGIECDGSKDYYYDFDVEPPYVRECRRRNILSVVNAWGLVKSVLAKLAVKMEQEEKNDSRKNEPTDTLSNISFQNVLCICLKMEAILPTDAFDFPLGFILVLLKMSPKRRKRIKGYAEAATKCTVDNNHNLPLHIALDQMEKNGLSRQFTELIRELIKVDPGATRVRNSRGQLPLTSVLKMGTKCDDVAKAILLSNPVAFFDQEDEQVDNAGSDNAGRNEDRSTLIPFVLERISEEGDVNEMYELFREKPEFVFCFQDSILT